jgi:hypothetical protein
LIAKILLRSNRRPKVEKNTSIGNIFFSEVEKALQFLTKAGRRMVDFMSETMKIL